MRLYLKSLILIAALSSSAWSSSAPFSGTVSYQGKQWQIKDAVAIKEFMGTKLIFSPQLFARAEWVANGKLDRSDPFNFGRADTPMMLKIDVRDDGYNGHAMTSFSFGPGEGSRSEKVAGFKLSTQNAQKLAGSFDYKDQDYVIKLTFDLPVLKEDQVLERPGVALPADGGAPGKAFLMTMSATAKGDKAEILALAPAEQRASMRAMMAQVDWPKKLAMMQ